MIAEKSCIKVCFLIPNSKNLKNWFFAADRVFVAMDESRLRQFLT